MTSRSNGPGDCDGKSSMRYTQLKSKMFVSFPQSLSAASLLALCLTFPACAQQSAEPRVINFLIAREGNISLKRAEWIKSVPVFFGATISTGDELVADTKTARAIIACADMSVRNVTDFPSGLPCEAQGPVLTYKDSRVAPARNAATSSISVVSPRSTYVLDPHPTIRWTPLAGIDIYHLTVRGPGLNWSIDVRGRTELTYPQAAPALSANVPYKVTVSAGGHSSDEDKAPNLGFSVLSPGQADRVRTSEEKLRSLNLPHDTALLLLAALYAGNELNGGAIEMLESARATKEPVLLLRLADLLLRVQRIDDVVELYQEAADIAVARGDLESEAIANEQLGSVYGLARGNAGRALTHIDRAIAIYQSLGDEKHLDQLKQKRMIIERS
jgi:hypothetical protein